MAGASVSGRNLGLWSFKRETAMMVRQARTAGCRGHGEEQILPRYAAWDAKFESGGASASCGVPRLERFRFTCRQADSVQGGSFLRKEPLDSINPIET